MENWTSPWFKPGLGEGKRARAADAARGARDEGDLPADVEPRKLAGVHQNVSLMPNCACLGSRATVALPKLAEGV